MKCKICLPRISSDKLTYIQKNYYYFCFKYGFHLNIHPCTPCVSWYQWRPEKTIRPSGTKVAEDCQHMEFQKLNVSPLEQHLVLCPQSYLSSHRGGLFKGVHWHQVRAFWEGSKQSNFILRVWLHVCFSFITIAFH